MQNVDIIGEWRGNSDNVPVTLSFLPNNMFRFTTTTNEGIWEVENENLKLTFVTDNNFSVTYNRFQLDQNNLVIHGEHRPLYLERVQKTTSPVREDIVHNSLPHDMPVRSPYLLQKNIPLLTDYQNTNWGIQFKTPYSWFYSILDHNPVLLSYIEPGIVNLRFYRSYNEQVMHQRYNNGFTERGVALEPMTEKPIELDHLHHDDHKLFRGDYQDCTQTLRARVIAVLTPFGDAILILGMTDSAEKFTVLTKRLEELAGSITTQKPCSPLPMDVLPGKYTDDRSTEFELSPNRAFVWGDQGQGTFECIGNELEGDIVFKFDSMAVNKMKYVFDDSGNILSLNGARYRVCLNSYC